MTKEENDISKQDTSKDEVKKDDTSKDEVKKDEAYNYKKAMEEARNKAKIIAEQNSTLTEELETLKKYKEDIENKEKMKKGQYEDIIKDQAMKIDELSKIATQFEAIEIKRKESLQSEYDNLTSTLNKELLTKYEPVVWKLELEDKVNFLKTLSEDVTKKDFSTTPKGGGKDWASKGEGELFNTLKQKINSWEKVTPSERWEYLNLLRKTLNNNLK